jgi:hypothetical protein
MTSTGKALLIGGGIVVLGGIVCVAAIVIWLVYAGARMTKEADKQAAEGRSFGLTTDQRGCLDEGLSRAKEFRAIDIGSMVTTQTFVDKCLGSSKKIEGFCNDVPSRWGTDKDDWMKDECAKVNMSPLGSGCMAPFKAQLEYCYRNRLVKTR